MQCRGRPVSLLRLVVVVERYYSYCGQAAEVTKASRRNACNFGGCSPPPRPMAVELLVVELTSVGNCNWTWTGVHCTWHPLSAYCCARRSRAAAAGFSPAFGDDSSQRPLARAQRLLSHVPGTLFTCHAPLPAEVVATWLLTPHSRLCRLRRAKSTRSTTCRRLILQCLRFFEPLADRLKDTILSQSHQPSIDTSVPFSAVPGPLDHASLPDATCSSAGEREAVQTKRSPKSTARSPHAHRPCG